MHTLGNALSQRKTHFCFLFTINAETEMTRPASPQKHPAKHCENEVFSYSAKCERFDLFKCFIFCIQAKLYPTGVRKLHLSNQTYIIQSYRTGR